MQCVYRKPALQCRYLLTDKTNWGVGQLIVKFGRIKTCGTAVDGRWALSATDDVYATCLPVVSRTAAIILINMHDNSLGVHCAFTSNCTLNRKLRHKAAIHIITIETNAGKAGLENECIGCLMEHFSRIKTAGKWFGRLTSHRRQVFSCSE